MSDLKIKLGRGAELDARVLVDTRMLVTANSGGGKSWVLRLVGEQGAPKIQTIVLDSEGEFLSLRELVDVVLVSKEGEIVPDVRSAPLLARKLLELGVSAVVDLYDLPMTERRQFMRAFLTSMMSAPKKLWHPCLVIIDEAHKFCPERSSGQSESTDAVITLLSQGRKRGYCGILATQRISKLHKDAVAECNNYLVGRTTLDVDVHRARDILGLTKAGESDLKHLPSGHWFGFGPAFGPDAGVIRFHSAKVKTKHPGTGERYSFEPPAPSAKIKRVLPELAAIPQEMKAEADELASLRRQVKEMRGQLADKGRPLKTIEVQGVPKAEVRRQDAAFRAHDKTTRRHVMKATEELTKIREQVAVRLQGVIDELGNTGPYSGPEDSDRVTLDDRPAPNARRESVPRAPSSGPADGQLGRSGKLRLLKTIAQYPDGIDPVRLGLIADVKSTSGTFSTYMSSLKKDGYVDKDRHLFKATPAGIAALGDELEPLPTGPELVRYWQEKLGGPTSGLRRMFDALVDAADTGMDRFELAEASGIDVKSGTFSTYLSKLRSLNLASKQGAFIVISEVFL